MSLEIGMIGQIVIDTIHPCQGDVIHDLGGLTYSIMVLDALMEDDDRMVPMTRVGNDALGEIESGLGDVSRMSWEGVIKDDRPNNRVDLRYVDSGNREERVTGGVGAMAVEDILDLTEFDGLLIDLVSGREIEPGVLSQLEWGLDLPVYLDLHSYLLDYGESGKHFWRRPDGWEAWLDICDILQVNRKELFTIVGSGDGRDVFDAGGDLWRSIRGRRVSILLVTDGEGGSWSWYETEGGSARTCHVPAIKMDDVVDPTGSGDVYGAVFFLSRLRGESIERSMIAASRLAGFNCARSGTSGLNRHLERQEELFVKSMTPGERSGADDGAKEKGNTT